MEHPGFKDVDFSNLKLTNSGGTALVSATAERWKGVTGCTVVEGYGLTECSPVVTTNPYGEQARLGTVGIPVVGTALKVIDEQGNELPVGERGELCERSASDEGVLAASRGHRGDSRCRRLAEDRRHRGDRRGRLRAYRRSQEGPDPGLWLQCYPNEIEDVVMAHPKVASCAAVGIPDEKSGEAVKLFVVARDPSLSVEELKAYCKENLTGYKIPRQIVLKDALPMTPVGKILRRELREIA